MKKILISTIAAAGLAASVYGQGTVAFDNQNNSNPSSTATSGGLVWTNVGGNSGLLGDGSGALGLNIVLLGGSTAGSLVQVAALLNADGSATSDQLFLPGQWLDPAQVTYSVPGVALSGTAVLEIQAWLGSESTYALATAANDLRGDTGTFNNATGGGGNPTQLPVDMVGMPALILSNTAVPEPGTLALAGLGLATLLVFRRRS